MLFFPAAPLDHTLLHKLKLKHVRLTCRLSRSHCRAWPCQQNFQQEMGSMAHWAPD